MYRYPERPLRVEEFECQLPPEARAELGANPRVVQPPRKPEPSPPLVHQAVPKPAVAISFASPPQAKPTATPWFIGGLLAIILIGMVATTLNHSGGAGNLAWAGCTGSRATAIVASQPVTAQPAQPYAQPEVRRAQPIDTDEVRRAKLVVTRAELVRLPGE